MISIRAIWEIASKFIWMMALMLILGFVLPRLMPGNPLTSVDDLSIPPQALIHFKDYYAPDQSIWQQLWLYINNLINFDFGYSFHYGLPVLEVISGRLFWTLFISLSALFLATFLAVPFGMWSAMNSKIKQDQLAILGNIIVQSVPVFIIGLFLQLFIAYRLNLLPAEGPFTPGIDKSSFGFYLNVAKHSVLPLTALTISLIPSIFLLTRNVVIRVKNECYVEMAKYFNITDRAINRWYILRNSLPEIVGKFNIGFVYAVAGTIFIEVIFSYPGLGSLTKIAVDSRDYTLIQGIFLFIGLYGIIVNTVFELIQRKLNPWLE